MGMGLVAWLHNCLFKINTALHQVGKTFSGMWILFVFNSSYRISYLEIYNEVIFDLLSTLPGETTPTTATPTCPHAGASNCGLGVSEDERGVVSVKGLSLRLATSEEDALNMLFEVKYLHGHHVCVYTAYVMYITCMMLYSLQ